MIWLAHAATRVGDWFAAPFGDHAGWALAVFSVAFGAAALLLFKVSTRQRELATARGRLIGRLYEAALYQTSLAVIARVQGAVLRANLRYLVFALPAVLALLAPLLLVIPQLEARFGRRPLNVGEAALVTVTLSEAVSVDAPPVMTAAVGVAVEAGPVRDRAAGTVTWRVRALAPGEHQLSIEGLGAPLALDVPVAVDGLPAVTRARHRSGWEHLLQDPGGEPLAATIEATRAEVALPARHVPLAGVTLHWLWGFSVLAIAAGLLLRGPLRVEL